MSRCVRVTESFLTEHDVDLWWPSSNERRNSSSMAPGGSSSSSKLYNFTRARCRLVDYDEVYSCKIIELVSNLVRGGHVCRILLGWPCAWERMFLAYLRERAADEPTKNEAFCTWTHHVVLCVDIRHGLWDGGCWFDSSPGLIFCIYLLCRCFHLSQRPLPSVVSAAYLPHTGYHARSPTPRIPADLSSHGWFAR